MMSRRTHLNLETALMKLFPAPDESFLGSLERELLSRFQRLTRPHKAIKASLTIAQRISAGLRAHRRASIAIGILLAIILSILAIGPSRLASAWQHLSYYLTGVGFVDIDQSLALSAPVEDTRDGVTIRIEQVLAQPDRTIIVLEIEGMSYEVQSRFFDTSYLLLPDGYPLRRPYHSNIGYDHVHTILYFPQIPGNVRQVSLVWTDEFNRRLVCDGLKCRWEETSAAWSIPLTLRPAHEVEQTAFPFTYQLIGASDTQHGITFEVASVSHDEAHIAVDLRWRWPLGDHNSWAFPYFPNLHDESVTYAHAPINLIDEVQIPYQEIEIQDPIPRRYGESRLTHLFYTAGRDARHYTLQVDAISIRYVLYEYFQVDLGSEPQLGDEWVPDLVIDLDGMPLRLASARLSEAPEAGPMAISLDLTWELPSELEALSLSGLDLDTLLGPDPEPLDWVIWNEDPNTLTTRTLTTRTLIATQDYPLPSGIVKMYTTFAGIRIQGPWIINWDVPEQSSP